MLESFSPGVLLWRLRGETSGNADEAVVEAVEKKAAQGVGYTRFVPTAWATR